MTLLAKATPVIFFAASYAGLGACCQNDSSVESEPLLREITSEEFEAAREKERREANRYREALAAAPVYRSEIRDLIIRYPRRYRSSGRIGLGELWYGDDSSQAFRCIHPEEPIIRAEQDGWQMVRCDRHSAYFLRGPVVTAENEDKKKIPPTVEEVFDVLRISYGSASLTDQEASSQRRSFPIRNALPAIFEPPTKADLAQARIAPDEGDEVRVAYYDSQRRKEISVYYQASQTVVTVIFRQGEDAGPSGARGTRSIDNVVVWAQSPRTDLAAMSGLLSLAQDYVKPSFDNLDRARREPIQ